MKKLWFNSVVTTAIFCLLMSACKQRTATEMESAVDTTALRHDTSATQPDRTNVEPDSIPSSGGIEPGGGKNATPASPINGGLDENDGDSKRPGEQPKPGKLSQIDSVKASYPPKK